MVRNRTTCEPWKWNRRSCWSLKDYGNNLTLKALSLESVSVRACAENKHNTVLYLIHPIQNFCTNTTQISSSAVWIPEMMKTDLWRTEFQIDRVITLMILTQR